MTKVLQLRKKKTNISRIIYHTERIKQATYYWGIPDVISWQKRDQQVFQVVTGKKTCLHFNIYPRSPSHAYYLKLKNLNLWNYMYGLTCLLKHGV